MKNGLSSKYSFKAKYLSLLLSLLLLCGCGAPEDKSPDGKTLPVAPSSPLSSEASPEPEAVYDLMKEKWAPERIDVEAASWNLASCLEAALPNNAQADYSLFYSASEGSCHYLLTAQVSVETDPAATQTVQTGQTLYWTRTDVDSGESVMKELVLTVGETAFGETAEAFLQAFGDNRAILTGMDVAVGRAYLFFQQSEPGNPDITHYYRILTDTEGSIEEILDLLPALQAGGAVPKDNMLLSGGRCDSAGLCYLSDSTGSRVCVIDREGKLVTVLEESGRQGKPLTYVGKLPEGVPLFACLDFQDQRLSLLCFDGQDCRELYRGEFDSLQQCLIRPNSDLFYGKGGRLFRWNVIKGTCECLYEGQELRFANCEGIVCGTDGRLYAVFRQGDGTFVYGFTDEKTETVTIRVEQTGILQNEYLQKCASAYTSRHPGIIIEVAAPEADLGIDIQLSRLLTRLSQGAGPDLILTGEEQLLALHKNGALKDLSEILPVKERDLFFPGALDAGTIADGLYGLAGDVTFSTLIVSDQIWPGESWTLSDILKIIREREQSGNPPEYFCAPHKYDVPSCDLWSLVLENIGHSTLLDLQKRTCRFDSEEFRRTLEFCKRSWDAAQNLSVDSPEPETRLFEGSALVCTVSGDLRHFSKTLSMLGEGYHAVGYPAADGESGHLLLTNYMTFLAVNARAEHQEIIDDFLRYYVSYQAQQQYGTGWIRTDILTDCVREKVTTYGSEPIPLFSQGSTVIPLPGKPDGSSYLPEFLEIAENSHPNEASLDIVRAMIQEEADAYFAGDKSLEDTVMLIQNRVQLYLDES